ncbi:serine hydroxymethyltransferase [Ornithinimicrobium cavernae]|uniref:serine hydroxymethyltransferase n=1 Tax=Ornithinimicrobium cavernae TaxID=2666047 RepID=UPI000D694FAA|nr:aminotransferase class I/II-fold pyridoxal phosphate-dependent enzyme [Ornithinimicrobium cavernae]
MTALNPRPWVPEDSERLVSSLARRTAGRTVTETLAAVEELAVRNRQIHDRECFNLNPATNVMNPRAEALLASGLGSRPSLGYPGAKYEMGLEAVEEIEVIAAELAAEVFGASYAEIRVPSGAIANLYAFLATCEPGDTIIAPPPSIGGHVTHHRDGSAGMARLTTVPAPVDASGYTVDVAALRVLAHEVRPRMITVGSSLNLHPHPVGAVREVADEVGAVVLFDAAHLCGLIAGGVWPNPLEQGAHLMTMSTYKSLGGPAGGLVLTNDAGLAQKLDAIAYPGLTANFDAAVSAALAVTLLDWKSRGPAYATRMVELAGALAGDLHARGLEVFGHASAPTESHQFAVRAQPWGGGQQAAARLRRANLLACGIGLPDTPVEGDVNGLRLGTPELARIGMQVSDMPRLADLIERGLQPSVDPATVAPEVSAWRSEFTGVHYTADAPGT